MQTLFATLIRLRRLEVAPARHSLQAVSALAQSQHCRAAACLSRSFFSGKGSAKVEIFFELQDVKRKAGDTGICRKAKVRKTNKTKNRFNSKTMKTMKNFAAQQLSKKAMNEVTGGQRANQTLFYCTWAGGSNYLTFQEIIAHGVDGMHCVPA